MWSNSKLFGLLILTEVTLSLIKCSVYLEIWVDFLELVQKLTWLVWVG